MITASLDVLFKQFIEEKKYVSNLSPNTIRFYQFAFRAFELSQPITRQQLNAAIVRMRESGKSPEGVNAYIRGINPFLTYLLCNGHLAQDLKLKKLKCAEKNLRTFTDVQIRELLNFKPKTKSEKRLRVILHLLVDTGLRVDESLSLRRDNVDLENLLLDVCKAKGGKFRRIPISPACRKILFKHLHSHPHDLIFCNSYGGKILYSDLLRCFKRVLGQVGISTPPRVAFHSFRRYWTTFAARRSVSPFLIQKNLGHSSLAMTQRYCRLETSDLSAAHVSALEGGLR